MLLHPTLEILQRLRLRGMLKALHEQLQMPEIASLSFECFSRSCVLLGIHLGKLLGI